VRQREQEEDKQSRESRGCSREQSLRNTVSPRPSASERERKANPDSKIPPLRSYPRAFISTYTTPLQSSSISRLVQIPTTSYASISLLNRGTCRRDIFFVGRLEQLRRNCFKMTPLNN
jgi:hypothetical protein